MSTYGVLLMTYGSPANDDDVASYMTRVRGGRVPADETVADFRRRYQIIGGSPLIRITQAQAARVERILDGEAVAGAGMRFSDPSILEVARSLVARGATSIVGIIISPQYSPIIMGGYDAALKAVSDELGVPARVVPGWHREPAFIAAMARRVIAGLERFPVEARDRVPVLMTAHSLPKRVVDREPGFVDDLRETAQLIASAAGLPRERWHFCYQSAGHSPEEWLKPDMLAVLPELASRGHRHALVAPVQFFGDHLETLYDIDIAGKEQAEAGGITHFARVPAPNSDDDICQALASVAREFADQWLATPAGATR